MLYSLGDKDMDNLDLLNTENIDSEDIEDLKKIKKDKIRIIATVVIIILFLIFSLIAGYIGLRKTELVSGYEKGALEDFVKDVYTDKINEKIGGDSDLSFDEITSIIAKMVTQEISKTNSFTGPQLNDVEHLIEERISAAGPGTADPQVIKEITTVVEKQYESNYDNMVELHKQLQLVLEQNQDQADARYKELKEVDERILKWIESADAGLDEKFRNRDGEIEELRRNIETLNKLLEEMKKSTPKQSADNNDSVTELQKEIKNLQGAIDQLRAVDDTKANIAEMDAKYAMLNSQIATINANISNLETYLDDKKADKSALDKFSEELKKLQSEMSQKADKSELSGKANQGDVDKLIADHENDFETLTNQLTAINADITDLKNFKEEVAAKYATKDSLNNLSTQVGAIDVKFTAEYEELQNQFNELNTAIGAKADLAEINTKLGAIDDTMEHLFDTDSNLMTRVAKLEEAIKDLNTKTDSNKGQDGDVTKSVDNSKNTDKKDWEFNTEDPAQQEIKDNLQALQDQIDGLKELVNQKATQNELTKAVETLNEKDKALEESVESRKTEISALSGRVDDIEGRLANVEGYSDDIDSLLQEVSNIKEDLANYYTKNELDIKLQTQLNEIQKITDKIQQLDPEAIKDIYDKIGDLTDKVDSKADKSDLESKANKSDLDSKADKSDLDSKADIKDLENKASKEELTKKADKSELDNKADKADLNNKADKADLEGLAKEAGNITENNINNYINQDEKYTYTVSEYEVNGEIEHRLIITEN